MLVGLAHRPFISVVQEITFSWTQKRVTIKLDVFLDPTIKAKPCILIFENVTNAEIPHHSQWGDSSCINTVKFDGQFYWIEMQTGDILKIQAYHYDFQEVS